MNNIKPRFQPATNWITTAVLAIAVSAFGIFAQTQASESDLDLAALGKSLSSHALSGLGSCDLQKSKKPIVLLYR